MKEQEYYFHDVCGVRCINLSFNDMGDDSNAAQNRRKKVKESLGLNHLDTPMIDYKSGQNGKQMCDIIMMRKNTGNGMTI